MFYAFREVRMPAENLVTYPSTKPAKNNIHRSACNCLEIYEPSSLHIYNKYQVYVNQGYTK